MLRTVARRRSLGTTGCKHYQTCLKMCLLMVQRWYSTCTSLVNACYRLLNSLTDSKFLNDGGGGTQYHKLHIISVNWMLRQKFVNANINQLGIVIGIYNALIALAM